MIIFLLLLLLASCLLLNRGLGPTRYLGGRLSLLLKLEQLVVLILSTGHRVCCGKTGSYAVCKLPTKKA